MTGPLFGVTRSSQSALVVAVRCLSGTPITSEVRGSTRNKVLHLLDVA
jgi:hypothetical protein